jgi:glycosyltransferase involved in cell wall biosynthesis
MERLKIQDAVHFYDIDDEILYRLYQNAIAFVYPSLYEGFGIPILEAFACQCPVLLSNASCFPEVAQQAALYFEPESSISMANQMERVFQDEALRKQLIQNGNKRALDFSPEKVAQETMAVYQKVVADRKAK